MVQRSNIRQRKTYQQHGGMANANAVPLILMFIFCELWTKIIKC